MNIVDKIIKQFNLKPLPDEGGYYVESYRSNEKMSRFGLPKRYKSEKFFGTAIFYLLTSDTFSALHRLPTDEIYHFYLGDPITMLQLFPDGSSKVVTLGQNIFENELSQTVVPKGIWQGSFLKGGGRFALMGTTMSPSFDFEDYEAGSRQELLKKYPDRLL